MLPWHIHDPWETLAKPSQHMLLILAQQTMRGSSYVASWHLTDALGWGDDLDVVCSYDTPGNAAMAELKRNKLAEEVPDLGCRYRLTLLGCAVALVHQDSVTQQAAASEA